MKKEIHRADHRGKAHHGWLQSSHSFSFASYYNPEKMGFGALRVLNDDHVAPGMGFPTHPHRDMEIVSIPLSGSLEHKDSEGHQTVIRAGEVQIMSAGTGVRHSEYNHSQEDPVNFLQIWVLPEKLGIPPRYDQKSYAREGRQNAFQAVVEPLGSEGEAVQINQQARFSLAEITEDQEVQYRLSDPHHGVYFFVLAGEVELAGESLQTRDALAISEVGEGSLAVRAPHRAEILAIEVPMRA